jgi:AcrR family transcriptional regulator
MGRRNDILDTAGGLFREFGYHATSMRDIAKGVGVRGSSLYAHIRSKEEVLWEIVNRAADAFLAQAKSVDLSLPPDAKLRELIRGHLQVIVQELPNATVFFHEWKFLSPELKAHVIERRDEYEGYFRRTIEEGVRQGAFKVDDVKLATIYLLSALNWTYQWYREGGEMSLNALTEHYTKLSLRMLGRQEEGS